MIEKGLLLALYSVDPKVVAGFTTNFYPQIKTQFRPTQHLIFTPDACSDLSQLNCHYADDIQRVGVTPMEYSGLLSNTLRQNFAVVVEGGTGQTIEKSHQEGKDLGTAVRDNRMNIEPHLTIVLEKENADTMTFLRGHNVLRLNPVDSQTPMIIIRRMVSILSAREPSIRLGNRQRSFHHL